MSDLKTLRLASIALTADLIERYQAYQRALLAGLAASANDDWSGRYAFAHGRALAGCGLDSHALGKVKAAVGDFCGRRSALRAVRERLEAGQALREGAGESLARLERLDDLEARYGAEAIALLVAREDELLALHRRLVEAEGGGHLHPPH